MIAAVIDLIIIIFLMRRNGILAIQKGAKPLTWKIITVMTWLAGRAIGFFFGALLFGKSNLVGIYWIGLCCAVGAYLIVKGILEKKPNVVGNNINQIGIDDLHPPKNQ